MWDGAGGESVCGRGGADMLKVGYGCERKVGVGLCGVMEVAR